MNKELIGSLIEADRAAGINDKGIERRIKNLIKLDSDTNKRVYEGWPMLNILRKKGTIIQEDLE